MMKHMYSIYRFNWDHKLGTAFMSDLTCGGEHDALYEVMNNKFGFWVRGRTRDIMFTVERSVRDHEGEIRHWELDSVNEPGFTILIWNDKIS